jgi:hypothetical protein
LSLMVKAIIVFFAPPRASFTIREIPAFALHIDGILPYGP